MSVLFDSEGGLRDRPGVQEWTDALASVDPRATLLGVAPLEADVAEWITPSRITASVLGGLSALALALLLVGVYGTLSYRVARRRFEIGVRVALGADGWALVRATASGVARVLAVAVVVGGAISVPVGRATRGLDIPLGGGVTTVAAVALALAVVCAAACAPPLRRALGVDPMDSLREE